MEIYLSKITFEDVGGGGGVPTIPCHISSIIGYSDKEMSNLTTSITNDILYTNQITEEWDETTTTAYYLFNDNTQLVYAPAINTSKVTNMGNMFDGCRSLIYVPHYDTSNVTNMMYMFSYCDSLTSLDLSNWNMSKVTDMGRMVYWCTSLTSLDLSNLDMSNVTTMYSMFYYCISLTDLNMDGATLPNINLTNVDFDDCTALTATSLVSILNALPTTTNGYTLTIGSTNLAKLTAEQIAIGTNKGWTIN